jgi:glutathione peroxidase
MKALALALVLTACTKAKEAQPQPKPAAPAASAPPAAAAPTTPSTTENPTMWTTPLKTLQGQPTTLAAYKGKALLLVNVASKCGLTPQYTALEALQKKYEAKGFTVVGFPCNQFGGQEPGSPEQIAEFCSATYGVTFPMMEKVEVNGAGRHPIYTELTQIADAEGTKGDIRWNFEKFIVSADGTSITRFSPKTTPDDPTVIAAIEKALPR